MISFMPDCPASLTGAGFLGVTHQQKHTMINDHITALLANFPGMMLCSTASNKNVEWHAIETRAIETSAGLKTSNYEQRSTKGPTAELAIAACLLEPFKPCKEVDFQN